VILLFYPFSQKFTKMHGCKFWKSFIPFTDFTVLIKT
jgi:hypothetical protein